MRTVIVRDAMRIPLGKQGENNAVRVVWPMIAEKYAKLYGDGRFELVVVQKGKAYPAVVNVDGADLVWDVLSADVATAEVGSLELIYYVGDTIAKSQTWETVVIASKSADGMTEPPEDPARAWFDAIKRQIGDLSKLTTKSKDNLVAAINEAARTGSGGGGAVEMRVDGGYIQYSTDGMTWENLIAVADLEGRPGKDGEPGAPGAPGKNGEPGKDGRTPKIAATKTGKITSITADGVEIAQIKDGEDAAPDLSLGITGAQIGQIAKITAVDETGKPTKWEPVEMAGGESEYELVFSDEIKEDVGSYYRNTDMNGEPFSLTDVVVVIFTKAFAESTNSAGRAISFVESGKWGLNVFGISNSIPNDGSNFGKYDVSRVKLVNGYQIRTIYNVSQNNSNVFGTMQEASNLAAGMKYVQFFSDKEKLFSIANPKGAITCLKIVGYTNPLVSAGSIIKMYKRKGT